MWKPQSIYSDFILKQPTILVGEDAVAGLAIFPASKIAIIHGQSLSGEKKLFIKKIFSKKAFIFLERTWVGEPDIVSVRDIVSKMEKFKPDLIIAIGGGSIIDGAKLCRLYYEFPFFSVKETKLMMLSFKTKFIAIPTTIGSGAEVSSAAVYINREKKCKEMIVNHDLQPEVVVLDPDYVSCAPENMLITSALDALGHIIEGYISNKNNPGIDMYAEMGLRILYEELFMKDRDFLRLQYAGYMGGIVQNHCLVGAAHAIGHQLSDFGYSHGEAVALLLPSVIRANVVDEKVRLRINELCNKTGVDSLDALISFIEAGIEKSNINSKKSDLVKILERLKGNEEFITNVVNDKGGMGNPITLDEKYIEQVIEDLKNGI